MAGFRTNSMSDGSQHPLLADDNLQTVPIWLSEICSMYYQVDDD